VDINPLVQRNGLFMQDEWRMNQAWLLSLGLRFDQATGGQSTHSPRVGLIWQPNSAWTAKLLTGRAYRSANAFESQSGDGILYLTNPGLQPETIHTNEAVVEWLNSEQMRLQLSLYDNKLANLIQEKDIGAPGPSVFQYQNQGSVRMYGAELGVEKITASNLKLRASISGSRAQNDQGTKPDNSPSWIAKASVIAPVFGHSAYLAAEIQAIDSLSYTWNATPYRVGSEVLANATLTFPDVWAKGLQAQLRVTNLFNRDVQNPASTEMLIPTVPQYGRNLLAKLEYAF
jgi:iron complex outermembrane receptor protein